MPRIPRTPRTPRINRANALNIGLIRYLAGLRDVFFTKKEFASHTDPEARKQVIVGKMTAYCQAHNEYVRGEHAPEDSDAHSCGLRITLDGTSYACFRSRSTVPDLLEQAFYTDTADSDLLLFVSALIIAMARAARISKLLLPGVDPADDEVRFGTPISAAVEKLAEWIRFPDLPAWLAWKPGVCYAPEIREEFEQYFPNTFPSMMLLPAEPGPYFDALEHLRGDGWNIVVKEKHDPEDDEYMTDEVVRETVNAELLDEESELYYRRIEQKFRREAGMHVVYAYFIRHVYADTDMRSLTMLKENCTIFINWDSETGKRVIECRFKPMVVDTIREMAALTEQICAEVPAATLTDIRLVLGYLARVASLAEERKQNEYYARLDSDFENKMLEMFSPDGETAFGYSGAADCDYSSYVHGKVREIIKKLIEKKILCRKGRELVYFAYKDYRLIFYGMYIARDFGTKRNIPLEDMARFTLLGDSTEAEPDHMKLHFNRYVLLLTSVLYFMHGGAREELLRFLIKDADDFSVAKRNQQVKAIYIISYFLCHGSDMPSGLRRRAFDATFGTCMYEFQIREALEMFFSEDAEHSARSKAFFLQTVQNTLADSCTFSGEYAKADPLYIFWGGFLEKWDFGTTGSLEFLRGAMKLHRDVWLVRQKFGEHFDESLCARIITKLTRAHDKIMQYEQGTLSEKDSVLGYVHASQILLYALADYAILLGSRTEFLNYIASRRKLTDRLIRCAVYADYYSRKFCRGYNNGGRMFLLCGSLRFFCAYSFEPGTYETVAVPEEMAKRYRAWYLQEPQMRYRALLWRMFSYTDLPVKRMGLRLCARGTERWDKNTFLKYDNIPDLKTFNLTPYRLQIHV